MQLGMFRKASQIFTGGIWGGKVIALERLARELHIDPADGIFGSMRRFLEAVPNLAQLSSIMERHQQEMFGLEEVEVLAPILDPSKVIGIGLNYRDHAVESQMAIPEEPIFFTKFASSIIGNGQPIILPRLSKEVDYEAELAVVIGRGGKDIPEEEALQHVAGYTVFNDVSARDLQFRGGQWVKGKALDTFAPIGPFLVTADAISDPQQLGIKLWLNGKLMQNSNTNQLIFSISQLISFLSQLFTLEAGDIIATGTPPGVGFARKPPVFLKPGDEVRIEIEQIGTLVNPVIS